MSIGKTTKKESEKYFDKERKSSTFVACIPQRVEK
jgi:hypothetical protein